MCWAAPRLPTFFQTMFAATASWPSRQTAASIGTTSPTTALLGWRPSPTAGVTSSIPSRPVIGLTPHSAARELRNYLATAAHPGDGCGPTRTVHPMVAESATRRAVRTAAPGLALGSQPTITRSIRPRAGPIPGCIPYRLAGESSPPVHRPRPAARAAPAAADPRHQPAVELASADPGPVRRPRPGGLGAVRARPGAAARGDLLGPVRRAGQGRRHRGHGDRAGRRPARLPRASRAGTRASGRTTRRCRRRSATSRWSSASPRCCPTTPAASACWPATTSRPPPTSGCR